MFQTFEVGLCDVAYCSDYHCHWNNWLLMSFFYHQAIGVIVFVQFDPTYFQNIFLVFAIYAFYIPPLFLKFFWRRHFGFSKGHFFEKWLEFRFLTSERDQKYPQMSTDVNSESLLLITPRSLPKFFETFVWLNNKFELYMNFFKGG